MSTLILRHLTGSRANRVDEIPGDTPVTIRFGRDPSLEIDYDPDVDDLVSRHHAELICDPAEVQRYVLVDLRSSNGTFVNGQRVIEPMDLTVGDRVQLGKNGPEFVFDLEPRGAP